MTKLTKNSVMSLGLAASIGCTCVSVSFWARGVSAKTDATEERVAQIEEDQRDARTVKERLAALEVKVDFLVKVQGIAR